MVVLDAVLDIQAKQTGELAVRWNCKGIECGSCSAAIKRNPKLICIRAEPACALTSRGD